MDNKWMPIATEMAELVKEKNEAYGDAVGCSDKYLRLLYPNGVKPEQYRDMLMLVRDFDKNMRIAHRKDAFGESPWRDKIGYALLVVEMDERHGKQPKDAPEQICIVRPLTVCYNEKCWKDHAYRTECWSNYFCHHRGEPERKETCSNCGYYYKNVGRDIEVQCCSGNGTDVACDKWKPQIVERRCETCRFYSPTLIGNCDYIIPLERECKNNYLSRWEAK